MFPGAATKTTELLRHILQQLEGDPTFDAEALAELKRIVLDRIAALQSAEVLDPAKGP